MCRVCHPVLLPRAAWGQGEVEPTIVGIPPRSASHCLLPGQDSKPQEAELGRAEELDLWDWGLGQGSRLCPPGEQGLRGGTEHSPGPPATQSSLPVVSGWSWQDASARVLGPDLPWGLLPHSSRIIRTHTHTHTSSCAHSHRHVSNIHAQNHTHTALIISPINTDLCPQTPMHTKTTHTCTHAHTCVHTHATLSCWEEDGD